MTQKRKSQQMGESAGFHHQTTCAYPGDLAPNAITLLFLRKMSLFQVLKLQ
ncbi:hypothetical protein [Verminephrobacter aporrectodeae]|uniref:hypothetical protein n=1 Tax=Verminephrobacter aporrectodeae TaxID=1110389 RepID=UPI00145D9A7D|nr:hypothetical protein [Verminephrobacter aporrectodeae]